MEDPERWKEVFQSRECRELFEDKVDAVQCATKLKLLDVFTLSDLEVVQSCATSRVACVKFLDFLVTKDDSWRELLNYLKENNQNNVLSDLEKLYQNDNLVKDNRVKYYQSPEGLPIPKHWNVPLRNLYFTGRNQLLEQLASSLNPSHGNITVISTCQGMGGVGKTQLAIEYAHRHRNQYSYIFWFMATQIELEYSRLAHLLNIDTQQPLDVIVDKVKAWLDRHPGGLLVYDNASNPEALKDYLPTMETSSILVTSRTTQWDDLGNSFTVNVFTSDEARAYFQGLLGNLFELGAVDTLAETLGYLPLALAQSGAYIKRHRISPSHYLAMYETDKKRLLASKFLPPDYPESVFVTWDITMQAIQKESQLAPTLLTLCACLNSIDIPHILLDEWAKQESNNPDQEIFEEALGTLCDYSILTINIESESVSIHCLVQEVIQLKWPTEDRERYFQGAILLTTSYFHGLGESQKDWNIMQRLLPHMEVLQQSYDECLTSLEEDISIQYLLNLHDCLTAGYYLFRIGIKLRDLQERSLVIKEKYYGPDHPEVVKSLHSLGTAYGYLGEYIKQRDLLQRSLSMEEKHYGPDHPELANSLHSLGNAFGDLGEYTKQRELLERALPTGEKYYGPDHPEVAKILTHLGSAYGSLGEYTKQRELLERALPIFEKHYGPDHPQLAAPLANLGNVYGSLKEYMKQRELYERAIPIEEKHYGPEHTQVAITLSNLGCAYGSLGEHTKERELLERSVSIFEKHYGPDHLEVAITLTNLGNAYGSLGEYTKQRELLEHALPILEKNYSLDHPQVARTLGNLGNAYGSLGEYMKQRDLLERSVSIFEKHYGPDHPQVALTLNNLGNAYGSLGKYTKRRDLLERALPILEKNYGPDHPQVARTLGNLENAYGHLREYTKQRDLLERALLILEKHYGPDHPEVAKTLTNLGNAYGSLGEYMKQRDLLERALPILEKHYGPDHPEVAKTLTNLGNAYGDLGEYMKQRELLERALVIQEKHYGPGYPDMAKTLGNLGNAYGSLGEYTKQRELLERALFIQEKHYGPDHIEVVATLVNLGNAYGSRGEYTKRRELLECALPILEKHYGPDHLEVGKTLFNLGNAYGDLGEYTKRRDLLERALLVFQKHYRPDHLEVARTLGNLGNTYGSLGEYMKQRDILERALPIFEKQYAPDHPEVAATIVNLGNAYGSLGEYTKRRDLLERALLFLDKHYGLDHPEMAVTLLNLGNAYGSLGEYRKRRDLLERALLILEQHYGPNHPEMAATLVNLGNAHGSLGEHSKQRELLERALLMEEKRCGPYYPGVIQILVSLGNAYGSLGEYTKQREKEELAIEKALSSIRRRLDDGTSDEIIKMSWNFLCSLTDESPTNCEKFLRSKGMELFHGCYQRYPEKAELLNSMMVVMNNIAEVKSLRPELMSSQYIDVFCKLLENQTNAIGISYSSAGVLSHVCSDGAEAWIIDTPTRQNMMDAMNAAMKHWYLSTKPFISYKSFEPIFRLVPLEDCSAAQHWALWTLAHLTSVDGDKYYPLVVKEGGVQLLENLSLEGNPLATELKELATLILSNVHTWRKLLNEEKEQQQGLAYEVKEHLTLDDEIENQQ